AECRWARKVASQTARSGLGDTSRRRAPGGQNGADRPTTVAEATALRVAPALRLRHERLRVQPDANAHLRNAFGVQHGMSAVRPPAAGAGRYSGRLTNSA